MKIKFWKPARITALLCCIALPSLAFAVDAPPKEKPTPTPGKWGCEINQKGAPWCGPCHEQKDKACQELVPGGKCVWQTVPGSPGKECLYLTDGGPDYCYTDCDVEGSNCNVPRIPANTACCSYPGPQKEGAPPACKRCDFKDKAGKDDPKKMRDDLWKGKPGSGPGGGRKPPPPPPPARDCCPPAAPPK